MSAPPSSRSDEPFDLEREARAYLAGDPLPHTPEQIERFVHDWRTKEEQVALGVRYFERDVGVDLRGKDVLEFGCATGAMSFAFEERGARVTAVDEDERLLAVARRWAKQRGSSVKLLPATDPLPVDDRSIDVVYSASAFQRLADPERALRELSRVLRRGGIVHLAFPNRLWPREGHTGLRLLPWLPRPVADRYLGWRRPGWSLDRMGLRFYSYPEFVAVLERSGSGLRVVCPRVAEGDGWRAKTKTLMHAFNIPYSAVTEGMAITLMHR